MATIKEVVLKHHEKEDGTYNIKYRLLTIDKQLTLTLTSLLVKATQKDFMVKDKFLLSVIFTGIAKYRLRW